MSHDIGQFLTTLTNLLTNLTMKNLIGVITNYLITNHIFVNSLLLLPWMVINKECVKILFDAAKLLDFSESELQRCNNRKQIRYILYNVSFLIVIWRNFDSISHSFLPILHQIMRSNAYFLID